MLEVKTMSLTKDQVKAVRVTMGLTPDLRIKCHNSTLSINQFIYDNYFRLFHHEFSPSTDDMTAWHSHVCITEGNLRRATYSVVWGKVL